MESEAKRSGRPKGDPGTSGGEPNPNRLRETLLGHDNREVLTEAEKEARAQDRMPNASGVWDVGGPKKLD